MHSTLDLEITERPLEGRTTLLEVAGQIDLFAAPTFKERILTAIDHGSTRIVIDLSGVSYMDSTGLSVLIGARKRLGPAGGELVIVATGDVLSLFEVTGLDEAFSVCESRAAVSPPNGC